jgi:WD40 repeat protein
MNDKPIAKPLSLQDSSSLALVVREIFKNKDAIPQEVIDNDRANINISSEAAEILPPEFLNIAKKLHQNYLYWQHLRDTQKTTKATFYLYIKEGIAQAAEKVAEAGTPIEQNILLILETRIALATISSLLLAAAEYLKVGYLQDAKESVDTALSTLYEFIKTREKLEPSLEAAVASIRQDIANEPETHQYASYVATQILRSQDSLLIDEPKFYVVRKHLAKLSETLILLIPADINTSLSQPVNQAQIDALTTRLLFAIAEKDAYITITTIRHENEVNSVSFSPDSTYLATASFGTVKVVEVATGREVTTIKHKHRVNSVSFSPDSTYLATISRDGINKIVEVATGRKVTDKVFFDESASHALLSPDSTYLAISYWNCSVKVVELATGRPTTTICHSEYALFPTFSPDGEGDLYLLEDPASAPGIKFFPDGTYLATASDDGTAKLVKVATGREITTIRHKHRVNSVFFSPDSAYLRTISNDGIEKIVEVATGREVTFNRSDFGFNDPSSASNGTYRAMKSSNKTVKLVEVATGRVVTNIRTDGGLHSLWFSPNGNYLVMRCSNIVKLVDLVKLLVKLPQIINEEINKVSNPLTTPQPQVSSIVHLEKPEAFFLGWLREESNSYSFYEYILRNAAQEQEGLSVRYNSPVLDTNLLLESLGFLLINAEKHYQTVYPTLIGIDEREIRLLALQDMKQSISAALSSLYEFIANRMELDAEEYNQAMERFKQEVEEKIDNSELLLTIYNQLEPILSFDGIKQRGELQTLKDMLEEMQNIFKHILPEYIISPKPEAPVIPIKQEAKEILNLFDDFEVTESELIPVLSKLKNLGLLNNIIALAAIRKITSQQIVAFCKLLPQEAIDKEVALAAINKRRETHYIGTVSPFTDIANKEILLQILELAPPKTWWRR